MWMGNLNLRRNEELLLTHFIVCRYRILPKYYLKERRMKMARHNAENWVRKQRFSMTNMVEEENFISYNTRRQLKEVKVISPAVKAIMSVMGIDTRDIGLYHDSDCDYYQEMVGVYILDNLTLRICIWEGSQDQKEAEWEKTDNAGQLSYYFDWYDGEEDFISIGHSLDLSETFTAFMECVKELGDVDTFTYERLKDYLVSINKYSII